MILTLKCYLDFALTWYAVGFEKDLPPGNVMSGRVQQQELAIWRTQSGKIRIFADRCPHRGMRLSHGFVRQDKLHCIYHGWQYTDDGSCDYIPAHPSLLPPSSICVKQFDCVEQDGIIWLTFDADRNDLPNFKAFAPVRSIEFEVTDVSIASFFGQPGSNIIFAGKDRSHILLLQPTFKNRCFVHLLTTKNLSHASLWLEEQRTFIEEKFG